jgi:hypothetical protein
MQLQQQQQQQQQQQPPPPQPVPCAPLVSGTFEANWWSPDLGLEGSPFLMQEATVMTNHDDQLMGDGRFHSLQLPPGTLVTHSLSGELPGVLLTLQQQEHSAGL